MANFSDNPMNGCQGGRMAFKSVFDPAFKYRTAIRTDIRETFKRVRREQQLVQQTPWNGQERRLNAGANPAWRTSAQTVGASGCTALPGEVVLHPDV